MAQMAGGQCNKVSPDSSPVELASVATTNHHSGDIRGRLANSPNWVQKPPGWGRFVKISLVSATHGTVAEIAVTLSLSTYLW
jgi:hypothetical protein